MTRYRAGRGPAATSSLLLATGSTRRRCRCRTCRTASAWGLPGPGWQPRAAPVWGWGLPGVLREGPLCLVLRAKSPSPASLAGASCWCGTASQHGTLATASRQGLRLLGAGRRAGRVGAAEAAEHAGQGAHPALPSHPPIIHPPTCRAPLTSQCSQKRAWSRRPPHASWCAGSCPLLPTLSGHAARGLVQRQRQCQPQEAAVPACCPARSPLGSPHV